MLLLKEATVDVTAEDTLTMWACREEISSLDIHPCSHYSYEAMFICHQTHPSLNAFNRHVPLHTSTVPHGTMKRYILIQGITYFVTCGCN